MAIPEEIRRKMKEVLNYTIGEYRYIDEAVPPCKLYTAIDFYLQENLSDEVYDLISMRETLTILYTLCAVRDNWKDKIEERYYDTWNFFKMIISQRLKDEIR